MLSKCANPACSTPFQYLRDGRLFQIDVEQTEQTGMHLVGKRPPRKLEHFWLCGACCQEMTLAYQRGKGVITLPLSAVMRAVAAS